MKPLSVSMMKNASLDIVCQTILAMETQRVPVIQNVCLSNSVTKEHVLLHVQDNLIAKETIFVMEIMEFVPKDLHVNLGGTVLQAKNA
jgi:hypothetical protein